jgi:hypothetical protein
VHERESAVQGIHSRWSSRSSQVIVDRLPSQPLYHHQSRQGNAAGRLQRSDSMWSSGSGVITDSPPSQPLSCHQSQRACAVGRLQQNNSMWSSGSGVISDSPPSQPLCRHQSRRGSAAGSFVGCHHRQSTIAIPQTPSKHCWKAHMRSATIKNQHDMFETTIRIICICRQCICPSRPALALALALHTSPGV